MIGRNCHRHGYLAEFESDKLLFHYRVLAKLAQPNGVKGGYERVGQRFHSRSHGGALPFCSLPDGGGDRRCVAFKEKADYMVAELAKCQDALGQGGYLAAFPSGAFDRLEGKSGDGGGVVVPYFTIHKIMAGLLDAHHYLGNMQARFGSPEDGRLFR